jgi:hypothetical protein
MRMQLSTTLQANPMEFCASIRNLCKKLDLLCYR